MPPRGDFLRQLSELEEARVRVPGVPFDQGRHPQGKFSGNFPVAGVLHRTYGVFGKDGYRSAYNIGKNGRNGVGIGFHFLIGKNEGQWVQFYDTDVKAAHAAGANTWAIGIEFDGVNEDVLTDWQVRAGAHILAAMADKIPLTYYDGPRKLVRGWLNHASVPGSDHTDKVTREDWARLVARAGNQTPTLPAKEEPADIKEADMYIAVGGVGFFAQFGLVTIPLEGLTLQGFADLIAHPKSVGFMTIPEGMPAQAFVQRAMQQTATAINQ